MEKDNKIAMTRTIDGYAVLAWGVYNAADDSWDCKVRSHYGEEFEQGGSRDMWTALHVMIDEALAFDRARDAAGKPYGRSA